jgi:hypothetical protein
VACPALPRDPGTGKVDRQGLIKLVNEEAIATSAASRRDCVISRYATALRCVAGFCHDDPRQMICLAYICYMLVFCFAMEEVQPLLNKYLAVQGGIYGAMPTMCWALPLEQLQGLAKACNNSCKASIRDIIGFAGTWTQQRKHHCHRHLCHFRVV